MTAHPEFDLDDERVLSAAQVCHAADATYRQLDHAIRAGLIPHLWQSSSGAIIAQGGSGYSRAFTETQALAFVALALLRRVLGGHGGANPDVERSLVECVLAGRASELGMWRYSPVHVSLAVHLTPLARRVREAVDVTCHLETSTGKVVVEEADRD